MISQQETAYPHWNVESLNIGSGGISPTYECWYYPTRIAEEIASAVGSPYPHFHAVIQPERNFLHYLISSLICNAVVPDKEFLFQTTKELFQPSAEKIGRKFAIQDKERILHSRLHIEKAADAFAYSREHGGGFSETVPPEWLAFFETTYRTIKDNIENGSYIPGRICPDLDSLGKIFHAACEYGYEREAFQNIGKAAAQALIQKELAAGKLDPLPHHERAERFNLAVVGVIGAGKNYFLNERLYKENGIRPGNFAVIDLDDFKEFDLIVMRAQDCPYHAPSWNQRAHDECHLIRRKIFDELEQKAHDGKAPNTLLLTSLLSQRALNWLTHDNPRTNVYLFYCDPDQALRNSADRERNHGRRTPTRVVLNSIKNCALSSSHLLSHATQPESHLFLQVEDATHARAHGTQTVLKASSENGIHLLDPDRFAALQTGRFINPDARHPGDAYAAFTEAELIGIVRTDLRGHDVTFYDAAGQMLAHKKKDGLDIHPFSAEDAQAHGILPLLDPAYPTRTGTISKSETHR